MSKVCRPLDEMAGSIGDLGTLLPFVIGAVTIAGLDSTGVLVMFGLMYLVTGWYYRLPIPVQPMKVIGAAILAYHLTPGEVAASGIIIGLCLLALWLSGITEQLARLTPYSVMMGIQASLGISLALLGMKMIRSDWLLGIIILLVMLTFLKSKRCPASILALVGGTALAFMLHPALVFPVVNWGFHLPHLNWPALHDYYRGFSLAALPQLPLTLTNSVLVTSILAHELFPANSNRVTNKNLCLTLGLGNLIACPLGGLPMCHGSGGLAAHYRFGGRTGYTPAFIGLFLLLLGILLGPSGIDLIKIVPDAVLGGLLFFSGIDLIKFDRVEGKNDVFVFTVVVILGVAINPAVGFVAGLPLLAALNKGWLKI
jgi:SulP family sulfate permease